MYKLVLCLGVLALVRAAPQAEGDLDAVFAQMFGKSSSTGATIIVPPINTNAATNVPCKTEDGADGRCVIYYLCNTENNVINDDIGILDIGVGDGKCPSYLDVCCIPPDTRDPLNPITPPPEKLPQVHNH